MSTKAKKKAKAADDTVDVKLLKALGHPLRQRILQVLNDGVASPNEVANKLGEPLSNVSYHVKILEKCDAIELVSTQPVRGALEHFYRAKARAKLDESEWKRLPASVRDSLFGQTIDQIWTHVAAAMGNDGFDNPKSAAAWVELELDEEAYDELSQSIADFFDRAIALQAASKARLESLDPQERESQTHRVELDALLFHSA
jgi:DNA-binding transcriptional ArsR family regulator